MGKQKSHRCPDCHRAYHSGEGVIAHRTEEQGECFDRLDGLKKKKIEWYRDTFGITLPPLPDPLPEFDPIDDGDPNG